MKKNISTPKERRRIETDWDALFPSHKFSLGTSDSSIDLFPLSLESLSSVSKELKKLGEALAKEGIDWENFSIPGNLIKVAYVVLNDVPAILSEATDIHIDDIKALPIDIVVELISAIIDVNMKSKESLEKNFSSLTGKLQAMMTQLPE